MTEKVGKKRSKKAESMKKEPNGARAEPTGFDFDQALQAIKALQEYAKQKNSVEKSELFNDDRSVYFNVVMKKYPIHIPPVKFIKIFLPHPFHDPQTASSCIFVRDLDKYPRRLQDREKSQRIYKQFFDEMQHLTEFTEVISVSQLLTDYKTYESRRKLCHSYDVMIADKRLEGQITRWLGKEFILEKKVPYLINVTKKVRRNFYHVFELTRAILTPSTLKFQVKIGRLSQPAEHLLENLRSVTMRLAARIPGQWENVRSAYIEVPTLHELPVYVDWGSSNEIKFPKRLKKKRSFVEDELSTLPVADEDDGPGRKVRVFDDGTVRTERRRKTDPVKTEVKEEEAK